VGVGGKGKRHSNGDRSTEVNLFQRSFAKERGGDVPRKSSEEKESKFS